MGRARLSRISFSWIALAFTFLLLLPADGAWAWGYQGHRVVGSIGGKLLRPNAAAQVQGILNEDGSHDLDLRLVGPWADCVKSVTKKPDGSFEYVVNPNHYEFEVPCTPFRSTAERARMVDYASRNWTTCNQPDGPCHGTFHFEDVAAQ